MLYIGQNGSMPMVKNRDSIARIFESIGAFRAWVSKILLARSCVGIVFWGVRAWERPVMVYRGVGPYRISCGHGDSKQAVNLQ